MYVFIDKNYFRRAMLILSIMLCTINVNAQGNGFDPAKFQADLEQYIVSQACLTPQEAAAFFPLYREMNQKQRMYFDQMRRYQHVDTSDDKMCAEVIHKMDQNDIQIKKLQQSYHTKFMKILPAGKVMKIIKAEGKFHRMAFKRMGKHNQGK